MPPIATFNWPGLQAADKIQAMRIHQLGHAGKTGSFAIVHLAIAISVGYLLTGSFVLAGLITLVEPALNTAAHWVFDGWWTRRHGAAPSLRKSATFAVIHFANAVAVVWALTGSLAIAGALAVIEPLANAVALHFFDRWWARRLSVSTTTTMVPVPA
jgi:uncharacterized membrane protein